MSSNPIHTLVTAGPTREKIDAVRDWGNIFSGQTGLDIALAFLRLGNVTLLTSNLDHARQYDGYSGNAGMLGIETFRSHADLRQLLAERMTSGDAVHAVAMTAAIADYTPEAVYRLVEQKVDVANSGRETWIVERAAGGQGEGKFKSTFDQIAIRGSRTEKLVDLFRTEWAYQGLLIKFKLEVGLSDPELLQVAENSRRASNADLMVANTLAMARPVNPADAAAFLIDAHSSRKIVRTQLPTALVAWAAGHLNPAGS